MTAEVSETPKKRRVGDGTPGPGRPKGSQDKVPKEVKAMVLEALEGVGGVAYLMQKAETHPVPFLALVGKVLPLQLQGDLNIRTFAAELSELNKQRDANSGSGSKVA